MAYNKHTGQTQQISREKRQTPEAFTLRFHALASSPFKSKLKQPKTTKASSVFTKDHPQAFPCRIKGCRSESNEASLFGPATTRIYSLLHWVATQDAATERTALSGGPPKKRVFASVDVALGNAMNMWEKKKLRTRLTDHGLIRLDAVQTSINIAPPPNPIFCLFLFDHNRVMKCELQLPSEMFETNADF